MGYLIKDFTTGEETIIDPDEVLIKNFASAEDVSPIVTDKLAAVIEALTAAANVLDEISYQDVKPSSRIAGLFAGQALQLKQQIDTLENLIQ